MDYSLVVPPGYTLPWEQQIFGYPKHKKCRSAHRYFHAPLLMMEARFLKTHFVPFKDLSIDAEVGQIWLAICPNSGTGISITLGNRTFQYTMPMIGVANQILTMSAGADVSYIVVIITGFYWAYAVIFKFSMVGYSIECNAHVYYHRKSGPGMDLGEVNKRFIEDEVLIEGGVITFKTCAGFPRLAPGSQELIREIMKDWWSIAKADEDFIRIHPTNPDNPTDTVILAERPAMSNFTTAENLEGVFPKFFKTEASWKKQWDRVNRVHKHFSECCLQPPCFVRIGEAGAGTWGSKVEALVHSEGQYLLTKKEGWSIQHDPAYRFVKSEFLHTLYRKQNGRYHGHQLSIWQCWDNLSNPHLYPATWSNVLAPPRRPRPDEDQGPPPAPRGDQQRRGNNQRGPSQIDGPSQSSSSSRARPPIDNRNKEVDSDVEMVDALNPRTQQLILDQVETICRRLLANPILQVVPSQPTAGNPTQRPVSIFAPSPETPTSEEASQSRTGDAHLEVAARTPAPTDATPAEPRPTVHANPTMPPQSDDVGMCY